MPRAAIRRNMDDWGRSKDSDGGAESITDIRPGQGEGKEGATSFRFDRFNIDVAVMHTPCFVGKNDACNENEIWEEATVTAKGLGKLQPRSMLPVPPHQSAWITLSLLHPLGSLLPSNFTRHGLISLLVRRTRPFLRHFVGNDQGKQERAQAMQDDQPNSR